MVKKIDQPLLQQLNKILSSLKKKIEKIENDQSNKLASLEKRIEKIEANQVKMTKMLKTINSNLKKFHGDFWGLHNYAFQQVQERKKTEQK